ncbi:hypothetical protein PRK78_005389 [Emydomyces testavorans]|uniref:Uncharacterized protein n=1 Tax=Emydomyces testavorans TaxID=2070801 RepID=A0AAF0IKK6_9EURO|nr:hypothetical protein PRK78_005389 [Emydomyces testavorans]
MPTRTSTRRAAAKANEALQQSTPAGASGNKRRGSTKEKAPKAKREKRSEDEPQGIRAKRKPVSAKQKASKRPQDQSQGPEVQRGGHDFNGETKKTSVEEERPVGEAPKNDAKEETEELLRRSTKEGDAHHGTAVKRSQKRQEEVPSNILEKGVIYFFFRSRVGTEAPDSVQDVARTFMVLRPLPRDAELGKGPIGDDANCRLLVLPKKQLPTSSRERYMGFVEKARTTLKTIKESFLGSEYETKTKGVQEVPSATPLAEGVYAIISTDRSSHLAYILTIPGDPSEVQTDFGLSKKGSFIVSSKNPKFAGPATARLPKGPEYPQERLPRPPLGPIGADFLMIGEAQGELGKAGTTKDKATGEEEAGEELEQLQQENEVRASPLGDDHAVFRDLGMSSKEFSSMPTTWE